MSRTRLIRPAFFADALMSTLSIPTRLVYIGLWTLCDDAGYFEWKPAEIAVALFPYDRPGRRQKIVETALAALVENDRIRVLECGDHGLVPTIPDHVQKAGNHAYTFQVRHENVCRLTLFQSRARADEITSHARVPDKSRSVLGSGSGSVLESGHAPARGLKEVATETGGFVGTLVGKTS